MLPSLRRLAGVAWLPLLGACDKPSATRPVLTVTAREFAYDMPDQVPAGLVQVRLINQGTDLHEALVVRLTGPDASASAYVDSVRADVDFPAFATDLGGPGLTLPGASSLVWLALERGRYAIVCWKGNHLRQGMAHDLEVTAATGAPPAVPSSTATVHLVDYAFDPSGPLRAGQQVLHIRNTGSEPHEADLFRLAEGQSPAEYIRWLQEGEVGVPPVEPVGGLGDLAPGREIWVQVTLRPGRYFWLCQVPAADGRPHYERGMVLEFTVS